MEEQKGHLKLVKASKYVGVSPRTMRTWAEQGKVPCYKLGERTTVFRIDELDQFLEQHKLSA